MSSSSLHIPIGCSADMASPATLVRETPTILAMPLSRMGPKPEDAAGSWELAAEASTVA
jgi:hypothetical protein